MSYTQEFVETVKTHSVDIVLTMVVWTVVGCVHFLSSPHDRFFVERNPLIGRQSTRPSSVLDSFSTLPSDSDSAISRVLWLDTHWFMCCVCVLCPLPVTDPSLSYPYEKGSAQGEEVPDWLVTTLAIPVVMLLLLGVQLIFKYCLRLTPTTPHMHPKAFNLFVSQLAFIEAMGITLMVTEFLKVFEGRKRPNFYAMCNYHGYRDALTSGNYDAYLAATEPGRPGSMANCLETDIKILREAQFSFPSGHSSSIWCGFTFVAQTVLYMAHRYSPHNSMGKGVICLLFFTVAVLVAGTRPRDYWHNFDDVLAGSIIGAASAILSFSVNYSEVATKSLRKKFPNVELGPESPLFDDSIMSTFSGDNNRM